MESVDDEILEYIEEEGAGSPNLLADVFGGDDEHLRTRCRTLESYGLLRRPAEGIYLITDTGRAYLLGDLDASDLERSGE